MLDQIHELEVREDYPAAIDALEERVRADPSDREAVIRLGFNLWYAVVEDMRMSKHLPTGRYATRFMELLRDYRSRLENDPDFCWAFGLGISLFWHDFPGADKPLGDALLARAGELDSFYARFMREDMNEEKERRFNRRGIFASYYASAPANAAPLGGPATSPANAGVPAEG